MAPAGTPIDVINKLHKGLVRALAERETRDKLLQNGMEPLGNTPEEFGRFIQLDMARVAKIVKDNGIEPE